MNQPLPASLSQRLNVLRGLSAWLVLLSHAYVFFLHPQLESPALKSAFSHIAAHAVMLFFVVSGFFITLSLLYHSRGSHFNFKGFLQRRVSRLLPPLYFSIALTLCVAWWLNTPIEWENILASALFLQGLWPGTEAPNSNPPLWSLSYEVFYYIMAMLFVAAHKRKQTIIAVPAVMCLGYFVWEEYIALLMGALVWAAGALYALIQRAHWQGLPSGFLGSKLFCLSVCGLWVLGWQSNSPLMEPRFAFGLAIATLLTFWQPPKKPLTHGLIRSLEGAAKYAYTLYVIHWPLFVLWRELTFYQMPWPWSVANGLLACLFVAYLAKKLSVRLEPSMHQQGLNPAFS